MSSMVFAIDIESATIKNSYYRKVIYTTKTMQLVLMNIQPKQDIPMEKHTHITQFIRVEQGHGVAYINGHMKLLRPDIAIIIPPNTWHQIKNTSNTDTLKLYSIYSPPEHKDNTIHRKRYDDPEIQQQEYDECK